MMPKPMPPLTHAPALLKAMSHVHHLVAADLWERAGEPTVAPTLRDAHAQELAQGRTGEPFEIYRAGFCDQVAASWVLAAIFVRTLEDRGYVPFRLAGPGAADRHAQFRAQFRFLADRDYVLHVFDAVGLLPGGREVFGVGFAPLWRLSPSSRVIGALLDVLRATEGEGQGAQLRFTFGRTLGDGADQAEAAEHDGASTRYLGDLYQDLNEDVRKRYALLQTPEFVERFLLDHTLDPAIRERGIAVTMIDPACGSGHLLLGGYDRLFEARARAQPGISIEETARTALGQVYGIDLNPYAAAIARFRLLLSYLDKAGLAKLQAAPDISLNVFVADSLLAGQRDGQETFGDNLIRQGQAQSVAGFEAGNLYSFHNLAADALLAKTKFDVVVANPPYITEKDAKKRELIRKRYTAAAGKFSLAAPFVERIFQLGNEGAFTGQITANSFMKREFGKSLIEDVLPSFDLTEILDTSGAFIPGHGTPTVILFGRSRRPITSTVRVVMGTRGEPSTPEIPAEGKVWSAIASQHDHVGYEDAFVSVADVEREKLSHHPWSLGGGGAAELKEWLEERADKRLSHVVDSIGISAFTLEDDVYMADSHAHHVRGLKDCHLRFMIEGDIVRDWTVAPASSVVFPYDDDFKPMLAAPQARYLWPWKTNLSNNLLFGSKTKIQGGLNWFEFGRLTSSKLRTPLSITFAFVATHNHFVLDRGGKVFKQTAPIIKLREGATEEEHLGLLGYLNSSTACFWMKQVFFNKGGTGDAERFRFEFDATKLAQIPLPHLPWPKGILRLARDLDLAAQELGRNTYIDWLRSDWAPGDQAMLGARLLTISSRREELARRMVSLQEELDWVVYGLVGLIPAGDPTASPAASGDTSWIIGMSPDERTYRQEANSGQHLSALFDARVSLRRCNPMIALLETLDNKRRWHRFEGKNQSGDYAEGDLIRETCESWLLTQLESTFKTLKAPTSTRALAFTLQSDPKVAAVAEVLTGKSTFDLESLLGELIERESVPSATCQVYSTIGIGKRQDWERTWALQRLEDAGQSPAIAVPPKYDQKDFENAGTVWKHRGKLDVPKERFVAYPTATPPAGSSGKGGLVIGWAGWNHLEQLQAVIELWQTEFLLGGYLLLPRATRLALEESLAHKTQEDPTNTEEKLAADAAQRAKLMPLLQTMADLLPWVRQWHNEDGETANDFEAYVNEESRKLDVTLDEARVYRRPAKVAGASVKKASPTKARAAKPADPMETGKNIETLLTQVSALDEGAGVLVTTLIANLGLTAAVGKQLVDGLVASGQLLETKKRPRMVKIAG